jgi:hypothetical protein
VSERSTTDIVDDIVDNLRPLKRGVRGREVAKAALLHIKIVRDVAAHFAQFGPAAVIRERAADAVAALVALEKALPHSTDTVSVCASCGWETPRSWFDFASTRERIELMQHIIGPDPRMNTLHWLCAHQAIGLVNEFSEKPTVTTEAGDVHSIAQLLSEAVTGTQSSQVGLLWTVRKVMKWRQAEPRTTN